MSARRLWRDARAQPGALPPVSACGPRQLGPARVPRAVARDATKQAKVCDE